MNVRLLVLVALEWLVVSASADGCFVFRWDKKGDINEPEQKAVILHHEGREDLLLQVKFEGPLEEFGWLIPVPARPRVERGSMDAFYELSELTQRRLAPRVITMGASDGSAKKVKVVEVKTVGAYKVAVLEASDAGSLEGWLKENGFSIPGGKTGAGVVDEYIRGGWFFVAVKIGLGAGSGVASKAQPTSRTQAKLAAGELHPLLISFDTERCVFPLKISSVAGKPSLVSLYVLSEQPLLNRALFEEGRKRNEKRWREAEEARRKRPDAAAESLENMRVMELRSWLIREDMERGVARKDLKIPELEDLRAIVRQSPIAARDTPFDGAFGWEFELLQSVRVGPEEIGRAAKSVPRLKGKGWQLTKVARTYAAAEMRDLEFEPAIPVLAGELAKTNGVNAATLLARMGADGVSALIEACRSEDRTTRKNGARGLMSVQDSRAAKALLPLLRDDSPHVRLNALHAVGRHWDESFVEQMIALFSDPHQEIREAAAQILAVKAPGEGAARCAKLLGDPDSKVRMCAANVVAQLIPEMISRAEKLEFLKSPRIEEVMMGLRMLNQGAGPSSLLERDVTRSLTSEEAAPLAKHTLAEARLLGLRVLRRNADAKAIELTLPLLSDGNSVVRTRAFAAIKEMTRLNLSDTEAGPWKDWWQNKAKAVE